MAKNNSYKFSLQAIIIAAIVSALVAGTAVYLWHQRIGEEPRQPVPTNGTSIGSSTNSEEEMILEAAKKFCVANGGRSCDGTVDRRKGDVASVKTASMLVLVSKENDSNTWIGILGSQESDICTTGSDSTQLRKLCSA